MSHRFEALDTQSSPQWLHFEAYWQKHFRKKPTVESIIFLVGLQEVGTSKETYTKEEKKDLMHVGICTLLRQEHYYELTHWDEEGWPHFVRAKDFEALNLEEQEAILQKNILTYFAPILD